MSFGISPISSGITDRINKFKDPLFSSKLGGVWVKITSGAGKSSNELVSIISNPNIPTFGQKSIHGTLDSSAPVGSMGFNGGSTTEPTSQGTGYYPRPIIESISVSYGNRGLSRKAKFDIKCYTKEQLDEITKYFLEPGFHVSIEWGWNQTESYGQLCKNVNELAELYHFEKLNEKRKASKYTYEAYIGIITGGGIQTGDGFTVSVDLTGIGEVLSGLQFQPAPATEDGVKEKTELSIVITDDTSSRSGKLTQGLNPSEGWVRKSKNIKSNTSTVKVGADTQSFAYMFNDLPAGWRTERIMNLINVKHISDPNNFINFIPGVKNEINHRTKDTWFRFFKRSTTVDGEKQVIPAGDGILNDERYIRFRTLMDILQESEIENTIELVDGSELSLNIETSGAFLSAFPQIFSTNGSRLYIPNIHPPDFGLSTSFKDGEVSFSEHAKKATQGDMRSVNFTFNSSPGFPRGNTSFEYPTDIYELKDYYFGLLDDLYINFDFTKSVLERKGLSIRETILELLNGMSSAVNNKWDFQVTEDIDKDDNVIVVRIVDESFTDLKYNKPVSFVSNGEQSPFLSFSVDIDIPSAMTSQIIGKRLTKTEDSNGMEISTEVNVPSRLFIDTVDIEDQIGKRIPVKKSPGEVELPTDDRTATEKLKENFELFMKTATLVSDITIPINDPNKELADVSDYIIVSAFNDSSLFNHFDKKTTNYREISVLLPISCKFSTFGVSGIQFNNTFSIIDLPTKFRSDRGIFQIREITHSISGMNWIVEVDSQFRQIQKQ